MSAQLPLTDVEIEELDHLLASVPAPLEALDTTSLDGFLCGVLLQPNPVSEERWWPWVLDVEGRPSPSALGSGSAQRLRELVVRRHTELAHCIDERQWFDPWVYDLEDPALRPAQMTLPWVAGFAAAMDHFPDLMERSDPALLEPLAVLYSAFDAEDLEDADELLAVIDTLEPPSDLSEAVEDLVRSVLLLADVTRPHRQSQSTTPRPGPRRGPSAKGPRGPRPTRR